MTQTCGHCRKPIDPGDPPTSYNTVPLCNPEPGTGRMECYVLVRDFHHEMPCVIRACENRWEDE